MRTSTNCKLRARARLVIPLAYLLVPRPFTHRSEVRQWKRLCPHLPAQSHLIVPKVARTHPTTAKTVIGRMRMQHQRAQGSITQLAWQDALLQAQRCRPTEQQRCAASFLVRALKSQPRQSAIHKAIYTRAAQVKKYLVSTLHLEKWSIHFDGKHIEGIEYQAVVLNNEAKEMKLTALKLKDGKAQTIAEGLQDVLEEFNLWGSIVMIVTDTTSVDTGKRTGVVVRLQEMFEEKGHPKPKFISCQHHVLDRVLRGIMHAGTLVPF